MFQIWQSWHSSHWLSSSAKYGCKNTVQYKIVSNGILSEIQQKAVGALGQGKARFVIVCWIISSSPFVFSSRICNGFFFSLFIPIFSWMRICLSYPEIWVQKCVWYHELRVHIHKILIFGHLLNVSQIYGDVCRFCSWAAITIPDDQKRMLCICGKGRWEHPYFLLSSASVNWHFLYHSRHWEPGTAAQGFFSSILMLTHLAQYQSMLAQTSLC